MPSLWYLSFSGDGGWLGGAYVEGEDVLGAVTEAHRRGCNPGGEVLAYGPIPLDEAAELVPDEKRNVLLDREGVDTTGEGVASVYTGGDE